MKSLIISADEIKKELEGYKPEEAEKFHSESAKLADKKLMQAIKESHYDQVILMCGGPASGKTEYLSEYLTDSGQIVVDGILPTIEGARIKIRNIIESGKKVSVHIVLPSDIRRAFTAFLHRDRKFSDEHFYKKHSTSRKTALYIAENYNDIEIMLFHSKYEEGNLYFTELIFNDKILMIEFLKENQLTEDEIIKLVTT